MIQRFAIEWKIRKLLKWMYGFDEWHVMPLCGRPYAQAIIHFLNAIPGIENKSVVEIGCGLGDIIRHIHARYKLALDSDQKVLRAQRLLSLVTANSRMRLERFTFPESKLVGQYDIVICVNWIHHITPPILKENIDNIWLRHILPGGVLVVDTVDDPHYRYNHRIDYLTNDLHCKITQVGSFERQRQVFAIFKV